MLCAKGSIVGTIISYENIIEWSGTNDKKCVPLFTHPVDLLDLHDSIHLLNFSLRWFDMASWQRKSRNYKFSIEQNLLYSDQVFDAVEEFEPRINKLEKLDFHIACKLEEYKKSTRHSS